MRWHRLDVLSQLQRAVSRDDGHAVAKLCQKHRDAIAQAFASWQIVPETHRGDPQRVHAYGQTLFVVAQYFAQSLGDPTLLNTMCPDDERHIDTWDKALADFDALNSSDNALLALEKSEDLIAMLQTTGDQSKLDRRLASVRRRQAEIHLALGDKQQGRLCLETALRAAGRVGQVAGVLTVLERLYQLAKSGTESPEMLRWSREAVKVCTVSNLAPQRAEWELRHIEVAAGQSGQKVAVEELETHLETCRKALASDPLFLSLHLSDAADFLTRLEHKQEARAIYEEAITLRRNAAPGDEMLATFSHNLADICMQMSELEAAERHMLDSLNIQRKLRHPDLGLMARTLENLGTVYNERGEATRASDCYRLSAKAGNAACAGRRHHVKQQGDNLPCQPILAPSDIRRLQGPARTVPQDIDSDRMTKGLT